MGKVVTIKNLELTKPLFPKNGKNVISTTIRVRKPIVRKDGREDYSDYSPLMRKMRIQDISATCGLTKGVVQDLKMYIERGLGLQESCILSGVDWNVFQGWRNQYPEFKKFIDQCQVRAEYDALEQVHIARDGGVWQASSWFLERKWPDRYGRRDVTKHEIFNHYNMFVQIVLEVINETDPELRATILNKLRAREINIGDQTG